MKQLFLYLLLCIQPLLTVGSSDDVHDIDGYFLNPQSNRSNEITFFDVSHNYLWQIGAHQDIRWGWNIDEYDSFYITLWQVTYHDGVGYTSATDPIYTKKESDTSGQVTFLWKVSPGEFDLSVSEMYFFSVWQNYTDSLKAAGFISHFFNITADPVGSSTATGTSTPPPKTLPPSDPTLVPIINSQPPPSASTSLSDSASGSPSAIATVAPPPAIPHTVTVTPSSEPHPSGSTLPSPSTAPPPSSDKKVLPLALGVGCGVGVPLVLLAGILVGLRIVRARRADTPPPAPPVEQAPPLPAKHDDPAPRYSFVGGQSAPGKEVASGPVELESPQPERAQLHRISELY